MNDYYGYDGLSGGALVALILVYTILPLAIYALYSWFYMKIFEKAGVQGKWRAWVPVYSTMIFYKLGDLSPGLVLYLIGGGIIGSIIPFLGWFLILPLIGIAGRVIDLGVRRNAVQRRPAGDPALFKSFGVQQIRLAALVEGRDDLAAMDDHVGG